MKIGFGLAAATAALALAAPASAVNLVTNGDFEAGNTGFVSDYTYRAGGNFSAAEYTVGNNPRAFNSNFVQAGDHTTGDGLMMIVNGSTNLNDVVWQSSNIAVDGMTDYFFEAFVMNVFAAAPPVLTFTISLDGGVEQVLDTLSVPIQTGIWNGLSTSFNSGTATDAVLRLRNAQTAFGGNDFAIDDINLSITSIVNPGDPNPVPAPAAAVLMALGLAAVGGARLRRKA
ncbi:hypothetical protein KCG44_05035 [Pacificimonas sp. WHA3]|uniref:PEP-CTERM protein-sorting domain-containing protein n=1 Tax=Pacificimonas pallii TaxID=2827236 RepID=A0ABS6SCK8_9SPHN|nr:hypothetical protein [Pacificimonas pallii]MBV7256145.1 hypothetical protein [Pacificimonas pallii]